MISRQSRPLTRQMSIGTAKAQVDSRSTGLQWLSGTESSISTSFYIELALAGRFGKLPSLAEQHRRSEWGPVAAPRLIM